MTTTAPAGWHPDPQDVTQLRYWDGGQWTEHRAPAEQPATASSPLPATAPPPPGARKLPSDERPPAKVPFFGARAHARRTAEELERLRDDMSRLGVLDVAELNRTRDALTAEIESQRAALHREKEVLEARIAELRRDVVTTEETAILQEVGVYEYRHPLSNSTAYKAQLETLQRQIKDLAKTDGGAMLAAQDWQVNGSVAEGKRMVRDFSKLMLRAYNAEADNLVRGLRPYKLDSAKDRLDKVAVTIERLGKTMSIRVIQHYHQLRIKELELTADYQEMLAREKEKEREERERMREERKVQQEMERERARLDKERQHYSNALTALIAKGDEEGAERMRAQLGEIEKAIEDVDYRAANARAGYVYVISNVGAFGERMVKIGMTRRLDPIDRVRELSDASVPFNFDVHALFFSEDAVGIENEMHRRLADNRVNKVNLRREFFYATPAEARQHLMELTGELLQFEELPEALEFHQSQHPEVAANSTP